MTKQSRTPKHSKRPIQEDFFRAVSLVGFVLTTLVTLMLFRAGRRIASYGVLTGAAWGFLSGYFLFRLVRVCLEPKKNPARTIAVFSILKFPVLYLAGYFILKSRYFPVLSLLGGLTIFLFSFGIAWCDLNVKMAFSKERAT